MGKNKKHNTSGGSKQVAPALKARFSGLIKTDENQPRYATPKEIEGELYFEFEGLKGVYFSAKLFTE